MSQMTERRGPEIAKDAGGTAMDKGDRPESSGFASGLETTNINSYDANRNLSRGSLAALQSPLTHPNGVPIFPDLSAEQQVSESSEATTQAESSIVADSDELASIFDETDPSDAGYGSDSATNASTSIESSVRDYMYENGRRYHRFREGQYNFPNDDREQEREDMKHAMVKLLCNQKLNFAPLGDWPQQILDIGTGTGAWAIEAPYKKLCDADDRTVGDQYPSATVLGVDLSPIQPEWVPPNVKFEVDDVESPWLYPANHFDYIHSRHTVMAIKDWAVLFQRSFEHLKPGGWIELQEIHHFPLSAGHSLSAAHPVAQYWGHVVQGLSNLGIDLNAAAGDRLPNMMREAGFINVTERVFHVPIGTWPRNRVLKTVGMYWRTILLDGLQAIALGPFTRGLQWSAEETELFLVAVRRAYHDTSALMYMPLRIMYAQKPMGAE
ncbi:secondary metabolism regulator LAE1 [Colletotrichum liriopes]|uniref:Secondary metabolism regulator LAE1 n=1 Tax=Colletotrichum liriopes TaxID=708192 RepID=A0AA37GLU3_9PEZI|nr:secondary metabolism regulator LAE1 [Colletotrichum liriopes]